MIEPFERALLAVFVVALVVCFIAMVADERDKRRCRETSFENCVKTDAHDCAMAAKQVCGG